ncbi:N-acetylmuramoyl-L-alanine amidase [Actinomadura parmotrematis]|uniref:N-acetylmuramoyl-L-alanine amidase n=1 Tax=Actinomadura parmotrematis TaxID=2864039 RepID=A0ABS7FX52_9ACTN|nr:N-acetylmuramoyl-L-alanine amidase [Actinomadura parmotrematis]MBW8484998.1 N-acetylmuramoyl-L-alanine amidase [Actinomadura parmotrematis]
MVTWRVLGVGTAALAVAGGAAGVAVGSAGDAPPARAVAAAAGKPLAGKVIVIDPGHNGLNYKHPKTINKLVPAGPKKKACDTTGTATASGYTEHAYTWDVANRTAKLLRAQGATVKLTRPNDKGVGPCVNQRAAIGNKARADAAISIHADGAPASKRGFHVILPGYVKGYTGPIVAPSKRLGYDVRNAFKKGSGQPYANYVAKNGIDVRTDLGGLNMSTVPKVFIECGNMRNATDAKRMKSAAWRQKAAAALAAGLAAYVER